MCLLLPLLESFYRSYTFLEPACVATVFSDVRCSAALNRSARTDLARADLGCQLSDELSSHTQGGGEPMRMLRRLIKALVPAAASAS